MLFVDSKRASRTSVGILIYSEAKRNVSFCCALSGSWVLLLILSFSHFESVFIYFYFILFFLRGTQQVQ